MSFLGLGAVGEFILRNWVVIAFYSVVVLLIIAFRKRFEFQGIVALYKTQFGVKFMTETGKRHPRFWDVVGLIAIVLGFIGMVFITVYLGWGLYQLVAVPDAPPALSPVIPGVQIPGVPFKFPFWYTLGALFLAIIVHEAFHGILSSAYGVKIKSSGFAFIGPIPGAFVEPDEEQMAKRSRRQQLAIIAGGPFANMALAVVMLGVAVGLGALSAQLVTNDGVAYTSLAENGSARIAGMPDAAVITAIDGTAIGSVAALTERLEQTSPGQNVIVTAGSQQYRVTLGENPEQAGKPFLGVLGVTTETSLKNPSMGWLVGGMDIAMMLAFWTWVISLGVGVANLIPLFMVDGGQMLYRALTWKLPEEQAKKVWTRIGLVLLVLVLILVFVPIGRAIF